MSCPISGTVFAGMDFCLGTNPYSYHFRFVYSGRLNPSGSCEILETIDTNCASAIYSHPTFGSYVSKNVRKWWHTTFNIRSKDPNLLPIPLEVLTTLFPQDPTANRGIGVITANPVNCSAPAHIPVPSFDPSSAPGWFLYSPTDAEIPNAYLQISSVSQASDPNNRRIFEYRLYAAYNSNDTNCTATSPNRIDDMPYDILIDSDRGVCWNIATLTEINKIGCCNLFVNSPTDLLHVPGTNASCSNLWLLVQDSVSQKLFTFDVNAISSPFTLIGDIKTTAGFPSVFFALTWDDRGFLWGLDWQGIRRIIFGPNNVITITAAVITKNQSSFPDLFPIFASPIGNPGISFSLTSGRMYIGANGQFWELEKSGDNAWEIMKVTSMPTASGQNVDLHDISFSPSGICYCIYNDKLAVIDYQSNMNNGFGQFVFAGTNQVANIAGMDFFTPPSAPGSPVLYGMNTSGQLLTIDTSTAATLSLSEQVGFTGVGLSSCQIGEDARVLPFPFYPGLSPWCFMIDISSSMANNNALNKIKTALISFLNTYVRRGDVFCILLFNDQPAPLRYLSQLFTITDVGNAISFIETSFIPSGSANLCNALAYAAQVDKLPTVLKSIVVIADGNFADCSGTLQVKTLLDSIVAVKPDATFYAVGLTPTDETILRFIGNYNNGGYSNWND